MTDLLLETYLASAGNRFRRQYIHDLLVFRINGADKFTRYPNAYAFFKGDNFDRVWDGVK